jgi:hypothetical protein
MAKVHVTSYQCSLFCILFHAHATPLHFCSMQVPWKPGSRVEEVEKCLGAQAGAVVAALFICGQHIVGVDTYLCQL